jgi:hypothetical protein
MSKIWMCKCRNYMVSDVEYMSIKFEPSCPKCGRKWSTFHSEEWPPDTKERNGHNAQQTNS